LLKEVFVACPPVFALDQEPLASFGSMSFNQMKLAMQFPAIELKHKLARFELF
jgi:hypothetical protein